MSEVAGSVAEKPLVVGLGPVDASIVKPVLGDHIRFQPEPTPEDLRVAAGAIVRASHTVGAQQLDQMPAVQVLARTGVGVDAVDVTEAHRRGIHVAITPGSNSNAVAEGAMAQILHLIKNLNKFTDLVRESRWDQRSGLALGDLEGSTLGILGYGRIGQRMHRLAEAFDMNVVAYDPIAEIPAENRASFDRVISTANVLTLHLPLTDDTRGIISAEQINKMPPGAVLINVARGGLIDEDAAADALETGNLSGLGLDSYPTEPPEHHRLYDHPNVVLSPHIQGLTPRALRATLQDAAQACKNTLEGGTPHAVV